MLVQLDLVTYNWAALQMGAVTTGSCDNWLPLELDAVIHRTNFLPINCFHYNFVTQTKNQDYYSGF